MSRDKKLQGRKKERKKEKKKEREIESKIERQTCVKLEGGQKE